MNVYGPTETKKGMKTFKTAYCSAVICLLSALNTFSAGEKVWTSDPPIDLGDIMVSPNVIVCLGTKVALQLDAVDMDTRHLCIDSETEAKEFQDTTLRIDWTVKKDGTDYAGQAGMNPNAPFKFITREPGYYDIEAKADDNPENPDRNDDPVTREAKVTALKVDILNVEGTDENGTLKVNCKATPIVHFVSYKYILNGSVIGQGSCDLNAGNFNITVDQDLFTETENTFEVQMTLEEGHTCSASMTTEKTPHGKASGVEIVSAYFIAEGIGLRLYNHQVIVEGWQTLAYSVPQSGRTLRVGNSSVKLYFGADYGNVSWGEEHKYVNSAGTHGVQMMSPPSEPYYGAPNTKYRDSSNNLWLLMEGLKGVSKVWSLVYDVDGGHIPATPILNPSIEVTLD